MDRLLIGKKLQWLEKLRLRNWLKPRTTLYELAPYTLHLHFSSSIENFYDYSILRAALFSAASPASSFSWLVGNK